VKTDTTAIDTTIEGDDAADPDPEAVIAAGGVTDLDRDLGAATDDETDTKEPSHKMSPHNEQFLANLENLQTTARFLSTLVPKTVLSSLSLSLYLPYTALYLLSTFLFALSS